MLILLQKRQGAAGRVVRHFQGPDQDRQHLNHVTKTTRWLHPNKLKALQDAGVVPVNPPLGLPYQRPAGDRDLDMPNVPVPAPWERKTDANGRVYYANHDTKATA